MALPLSNDRVMITVDSTVFIAQLYAGPSAAAFKARLPFTVSMEELNGNEKFHYFSSVLPVAAANVGTIEAGDLMLYGDNCLVLFYSTFPTTYRYTRLGRITDVEGLAAALGNGAVTVRFELN